MMLKFGETINNPAVSERAMATNKKAQRCEYDMTREWRKKLIRLQRREKRDKTMKGCYVARSMKIIAKCRERK